MEDDRISVLETQLAQARLIAEESDKKYEEVSVRLSVAGLQFSGKISGHLSEDVQLKNDDVQLSLADIIKTV